jgi:hypothetical protein
MAIIASDLLDLAYAHSNVTVASDARARSVALSHDSISMLSIGGVHCAQSKGCGPLMSNVH